MHELVDELDGALGGAPPTFEQLAGLEFLEAVLNESMRLLPPLPYTIRAVQKGGEICGREVRDGDRVVCSSFMTHHMPDLFPEPDRFDPHRWSGIEPGQYEYWPFSAGPRTCVGYLFAMTEMKIVLATILPRWRLSMVPGARVDRTVQLTLSPRQGLPMTVHRQDRRFEAAPLRGNIREMVDL
jgi:cytochrome P450